MPSSSSSSTFDIIYADPPWQYGSSQTNFKSANKIIYPVMDYESLAKLPVDKIASENSWLFLWGTWVKMLMDGNEPIRLMKAWGFEPKTVGWVWVKRGANGGIVKGLGSYTRANTEFILIGKKGKPKIKNKGISQVVTTNVIKRHSEKPDIFRQKIIKLAGDLPRIELFARKKIHGWTCLGNEIDGLDMNEALERILTPSSSSPSPPITTGKTLENFY